MNTIQPINRLADTVRANIEQLPARSEDAAYVGMFSIRQKEGSNLTADTLAELIRSASKGVFQDVSVERLQAGPSYIELGAWIGDQGLALALMGLGERLGLWSVVTPDTLGVEDEKLATHLMGMGFVMVAVDSSSKLLAV